MKNIDYDSPINQKIKGKLVSREVYACISDMADHLFDYDGEKYASFDEFSNMWLRRCPECGEVDCYEEIDLDEIDIEHAEDGFLCPICGCAHEDEEDARLCCWQPSNTNPVVKCTCGHICYEDDMDEEPVEIYEYWIVSPWFGERLRNHGCVVLERWGGWIWGRQATGQAILLDNVVSEIAEEMKILDGQPYSWAKMI